MSISLTASITLLYPLAIWLGQGTVEPRILAGLLVVAGLTRLPTLKDSAGGRWWVGGTLLLSTIVIWSNLPLPLKLYPVLVNVAMLCVFSYSLIHPPSIVERFARVHEPELPPQAVDYMRCVTQVWCFFFGVNGAIALMTALWASSALWSLYNGLIAYLLMGLLFGGEYLMRSHFKRRYHA